MTVMPEDRVVRLVEELKDWYGSFIWESMIWAERGHRRSPYRTLILFGLSARTRDRLLVEMCRRFFQMFPDAKALSESESVVTEKTKSIVRPTQLPIVASMARAVGDGVPQQPDELFRIRGVGEKIAECVLVYGWGKEALPLDANCVRVLERVFGFHSGRQSPAPLREGLKCVYRKRRQEFGVLGIAMVDVHEILRLHGQVCCARSPECSRCPVTGCESRRESWNGSRAAEVSPTMWDDWRELINEPTAV